MRPYVDGNSLHDDDEADVWLVLDERTDKIMISMRMIISIWMIISMRMLISMDDNIDADIDADVDICVGTTPTTE